MARLTKPWNWRFRSSTRRRQDRTDGVVLVIVMIVATLLLVALTAALPSVYQEGQREREAEVIFRGTQYARAVALFHKQFNRFPTNTKELMGTNGIKFLRKEYLDPVDPKGKWRYIHVSAAGVLLDSVNQRLPNQTNPAGLGMNNSSSTSSMPGGGLSFGGSSSTGFQLGSTGLGMNPPTGGSNQTGLSSSSGSQNEIQGAYIAGVAPTSKHESIRVWNKYHHYNEWEFIGLDLGVFGIGVGLPTSGSTGPGQQNMPPGSGTSPGGFSLNSTQPNAPTPPPPQN